MAVFDPTILRGCNRTALSSTRSVPTNIYGGVAAASGGLAAALAMAQMSAWVLFAVQLTAAHSAATTVILTSVNAVGTDYDANAYTIGVPANTGSVVLAGPGSYIPVGGPSGLQFGTSHGDRIGGFALIASNAGTTGYLYWLPFGSY